MCACLRAGFVALRTARIIVQRRFPKVYGAICASGVFRNQTVRPPIPHSPYRSECEGLKSREDALSINTTTDFFYPMLVMLATI